MTPNPHRTAMAVAFLVALVLAVPGLVKCAVEQIGKQTQDGRDG